MSSDGPAGGRGVRRLGRTQEFLKPIVYGGNDGIVTTFAIVAGFAGASAEGAAQVGGLAVIVFGLANLFADAVSMGLGEFLSARSERDLYVAKRNRELREMRGDGAGDIGRLLSARGLPAEDAKSRAIVEQMRDEEEEHGENAIDAGAADLPAPVKRLMQITAKVMTKTAYWL